MKLHAWLSLSARRTIHKLSLLYKLCKEEKPRHLYNKLIDYNSHVVPYHTRNRENFNVPLCRTEIYRQAFFPSVIRLWNNLDISLKSATSLEIFKKSLKTFYNTNSRNSYFYLGNRKHTSILSSIRTKSSQLYHYLYTNGLSLNKFCTCGLVESAYHYFFECQNYILARDRLLTDTLPLGNLSMNTVLFGYGDLEHEKNSILCFALYEYITATNRF